VQPDGRRDDQIRPKRVQGVKYLLTANGQVTVAHKATDEAKESDVSLGDFLWSLLVIYFIFFYFMILFRILGDLFSDHEMSGLGKTVWIIFLLLLPFVAIFVYLITRGKDMTERAMAQSQAVDAQQQDYIRQVAGSGGGDPADQIAKAQALLKSGAITQQEFDALKAKALA
jgi:hypothetical protein